MKNFRNMLILFSSVLGLGVGVLTLASYFNLNHVTQMTYMSLLKSFEPYQRVLRSARWPARRYELLMRDGSIDRSEVNSIESQMLQISFGQDYDYFILRSFGGQNRIEIRNGGLSASKSKIVIFGETDFGKMPASFLIRACRVSDRLYLCLVDIPGQRDFVDISERNYSFIAIREPEVIAALQRAQDYSSQFFPLPLLGLRFSDENNVAWGHRHPFELFNVFQSVDEGIELRGTYRVSELMVYMFGHIAFLMTCLGGLIILINKQAKRKLRSRLDHELLKTKSEYYQQIQSLVKGVIHDIKSPLSAMKSFSRHEADPERRMLMDHVIQRMKMIVNDLEKKQEVASQDEIIWLPLHKLIGVLVSEKSKEYEDHIRLKYITDGEIAWVKGNQSGFFRTMSNILNNAREASQVGQLITIHLTSNSDTITIKVSDEGKGIPQSQLHRVFDEGVSISKKNGSGLGLYQSKCLVEKMKGKINISSEEGVGTSVEITLPKGLPPVWATDSINFADINHVIVVDDEVIYEKFWEQRLKPFNLKLHYYDLPSKIPQQFLGCKDALFIVDNDFYGDSDKGIDFLEQHRGLRSVIVTANWAVPNVQNRAEILGVGLCGKDFLEQVEVHA